MVIFNASDSDARLRCVSELSLWSPWEGERGGKSFKSVNALGAAGSTASSSGQWIIHLIVDVLKKGLGSQNLFITYYKGQEENHRQALEPLRSSAVSARTNRIAQHPACAWLLKRRWFEVEPRASPTFLGVIADPNEAGPLKCAWDKRNDEQNNGTIAFVQTGTREAFVHGTEAAVCLRALTLSHLEGG